MRKLTLWIGAGLFALSTTTIAAAQTTVEWIVLSFKPKAGVTVAQAKAAETPIIVGTANHAEHGLHMVLCRKAGESDDLACVAAPQKGPSIFLSPSTSRAIGERIEAAGKKGKPSPSKP